MSGLRFFPAPMEGVMNAEFIRAANALELTDRWITPFFRLSQELPKAKHFRQFLAPYAPVPAVMQIMGRAPALLADAASLAEAAGASGIDLNFGCPSSQVTRHGAGGAILKDPELAREIVRQVRAAVKTPVSVKMRAGWDSPDEMPGLLNAIADAGPDLIALHFRTVAEQYLALPSGERERRFAMAAEQLNGRCPWLMNGDFATAEEMRQTAERFGAAGAMAARGFLRDPGLFRRAYGLDAPDAAILRERFFRQVVSEYPAGMPPGRAIELSIFLWGPGNPYFKAIVRRRGPVTASDLPENPA